MPGATGTDCSGMWIGTEAADYIFYAPGTTPVHQRHIVAHEIGHMAFGHQGSRADGDVLARLLFPDLTPALVRSLARSAYSDQDEREAETFASVLLGRVRPRRGAAGLRPGEAELLRRVEGAFTPARSGYGD